MLLAPWYRRRRQGVPLRQTRPVIQKYESSDFVTEFLADPQRHLRFTPDDHVHSLVSRPGSMGGGLKAGFSDKAYLPTRTRKLFLDTHKRFYLVVCELHCDAPGLPSPHRDQACEAGFVIRRRRVDFPESATKDATRILRKIDTGAAHLRELDRLAPGTKLGIVKTRGGVAAAPAAAFEETLELAGERRRAQAGRVVADHRAELVEWARDVGAVGVLEGWIPGEEDRVGSWQHVAEHPQATDEAILPLYPLVPDPSIRVHAGHRRTIYFGLIPTGSDDADPAGLSRFDDQSLYEIRCFVRRHRPHCPKKLERGDCRGELVWSRPTESYRLAAHFDLAGTSNRPVTVQLPDIPALTAQAAALPVGQGAPVKMVAPEGSSFRFRVKGGAAVPGSAQLGGGQICSFSIPLLTIVALFVFRMFLPIVVFLFGLWILLKLRFCIPPSFQIGAGVAAQLDLAGPDVDLDADFEVEVGGSVVASADMLREQLRLDLNAAILDDDDGGAGDAMVEDFSTSTLVHYEQDLATDVSAEAAAEGGGGAEAGGGAGGDAEAEAALVTVEWETPEPVQ